MKMFARPVRLLNASALLHVASARSGRSLFSKAGPSSAQILPSDSLQRSQSDPFGALDLFRPFEPIFGGAMFGGGQKMMRLYDREMDNLQSALLDQLPQVNTSVHSTRALYILNTAIYYILPFPNSTWGLWPPSLTMRVTKF